MKAPVQIVWDWNGTLLDDAQACINAINALLHERNLPLLDRERYRASFGFPVRDFYRTLGIDVDDKTWAELTVAFHEHYQREPVAIAGAARQMLDWLQTHSIPQSILSACEQNLLNCQVARHGLAGYFRHVQGTDNLDGRSKIAVGQTLIARLVVGDRPPVLIGDTLHDVDVAAALGCDCLLVANGHQSRARLERAGCPVLDSLLELPLALEAIEGPPREQGKRI